MLPGNYRQNCSVQTITREEFLFEKIINSDWWMRATQCIDSHYSNLDGIMLSDHLVAVTENIDKLYYRKHSSFLTKLFALLEKMNISQERLREELKIVSLLHDIGKLECDKSKQVLHPIHKHYTIKMHSIVSLYAAIEILGEEDVLHAEEKQRIYALIEEHDVSYGLFQEWMRTGNLPNYERWRQVNDKIDAKPGAGLLHLLFFKLADTHGHWNITDVIWFFKQTKITYFSRLGIDLPVPKESDIR